MHWHCAQELRAHHTWDPTAHPEWLVFEAEGQLQIRPQQYQIARHLMENPGAISQLNMGGCSCGLQYSRTAGQQDSSTAVQRLGLACWGFGRHDHRSTVAGVHGPHDGE